MGRKYIDLTGQNINGIIVKGLYEEKGGTGKHKRWKCRCPICNNIFVTGSQHLRDKNKPISMCFNCGIHQYDDLTGERFGRLTVLEKDKEAKGNRVRFICQCDCGTIISVQANHLSSGEIKSCGCLNSSGEEKISELLSSYGVIFEKQKTFSDCKNRKHLRFDFYIPENKIAIEYNGIQHYEPVDIFGGIEGFLCININDQIKQNYCRKNSIKLYTIDYDEDIEESLVHILSNEEIVCPYGNIAG